MIWSTPLLAFITISLALFVFAGLTLFFERKLIGIAQKSLGISFLGRNGWVHLPADVVKFWLKYSNKNSTPWTSAGGGLAGAILAFVGWNLLSCVFFLTDGFSVVVDFWDYQLLAYMAFANLTTLFMFNIVISLSSKYASLGAGSVLLVSVFLEVFFSLCFMLLYWHCGGYSLEEVSEANLATPLWAALPPLALFYLLYAFFEAKRAPFDHSEAESELVAGHLVEFGGRTLLFFYFCEYMHIYFCMFIILVFCLGNGTLGSWLWAWPGALHPWFALLCA